MNIEAKRVLLAAYYHLDHTCSVINPLDEQQALDDAKTILSQLYNQDAFEIFNKLTRVRDYITSQRGTGNCAQAIARNQAVRIVNDARFAAVRGL